jgi:CubicO group peptidase (beta-lactamase class C family)
MARVIRLALLAATIASATAAAAQGPGTRLDAILTAATRARDFNGSVIVARNGHVLLRKGYGYADVAGRVSNRPDTQFRISSLTTTFTWVALLQLVERGTLERDGSICSYLDDCPTAWKAITVDLVLDGRSGLPALRGATRSLDAWLQWLRRQPLAFRPGRTRDHGEARFLVATRLLERASGQPWIRYLQTHIFGPLGMASTGLDTPDAPRRATPYLRTKGRKLGHPLSFAPLSSPDVVYGLMSTVDDMFRFDRALHAGRLVSLATLGPDWQTHLELGHGPHGTVDGWYTAYTHRSDGVTILAFSNLGNYFLGDLEARLYFAAVGWPPRRVSLDKSTLARYVGLYQRWDSYYKRRATVRVTSSPGGLLRVRWDAFPPRLHGFPTRPHEALIAPSSATSFFEVQGVHGSRVEPGNTYTFESGADGRVAAVVTENRAGTAPVRYLRV